MECGLKIAWTVRIGLLVEKLGMEEKKLKMDIQNGLFVSLWEAQSLRGRETDLQEYEKLCEYRKEASPDPAFHLSLAWYLWGKYYDEKGDFQSAERYFYKALNHGNAEKTGGILNNIQIERQLLITLCHQWDGNDRIKLLWEDIKKNPEKLDGEPGKSEKDNLMLLTIMARLYEKGLLKTNHISEYMQLIKEQLGYYCARFMEYIHSGVWEFDGAAVAFHTVWKPFFSFLMSSMPVRIEYQITEPECQTYIEVIQCIEDKLIDSLTPREKIWFYRMKGMLEREKGEDTAACMSFDNMVSWMQSEEASWPAEAEAEVYLMLAEYYETCGKDGRRWAKASLDCLKEVLQDTKLYINDRRLIKSLEPMRKIFLKCYRIFRRYIQESVSDLSFDNNDKGEETWSSMYEKVLEYKSMASLAGQKRNRLIHEWENISPEQRKLLIQIKELQDQLSNEEADDVFRQSTDSLLTPSETENRLRTAENEFIRIGGINYGTECEAAQSISLEEVINRIPDHCAVLEYFTVHDGQGASVLDIYLIVKEAEEDCSFHHFGMEGPVAAELFEKADRFVSLMSGSRRMKPSEAYEWETLRGHLFRSLVEPVKKELDSAENLSAVYIAPAFEFINLPVELLYDGAHTGNSLIDKNVIIKLESARNFLFYSGERDTYVPGKSLIICNPSYELNHAEWVAKTQYRASRCTGVDLSKLEPLPFSEWEASRVAGRLSDDLTVCIGEEAKKKCIENADDYHQIHIATHGFYDFDGDTEKIYSSCLFLSGVKNWNQTGQIHEEYDNGLITADEISRLFFKIKPDLVVLSSCMSGMSDGAADKGFHGMVGAWGAAGARYVISHLWNESDGLETVILMDKFYELYSNGVFLPEALHKAKSFLKNLTVGELLSLEWLLSLQNEADEINSKKTEILQAQLKRLSELGQEVCPFRDPLWWGGFACFRCN